MNQLNFENFEGMPSEFLDTISEKELFETLESGQDAQQKPKQAQNPAPENKENNFFNDQQGPPPPNGTNLNASQIVSGELAVELLNRILPVLLAIGVERFLGIKAPKKNFELTAAEKSTISPILDKCLSELNVNFENPFVALALSFGFIYGSKVINVANDPDLEKAIAKPKQNVSKAASAANPAPTGKSTRKAGETRGRKPKSIKLEQY